MKVKLYWDACLNENYEYTDLEVVSSDTHRNRYRCVRDNSGNIIAGIDLSDPMVVLPMVLKDLGIEVTDK